MEIVRKLNDLGCNVLIAENPNGSAIVWCKDLQIYAEGINQEEAIKAFEIEAQKFIILVEKSRG
jgi:formate dehydrogenase assembly factor FdhD